MTELSIAAAAAKLAMAAHSGQYRRDGKTPYFIHCTAVAGRLDSQVDRAVGYLHDALEDKRATLDELREAFRSYPEGEEVVQGIVTLTRLDGEAYGAFIDRIRASYGGRWRRAKIADILANLSDSPTDAQILKYARALQVLLP